MSKEKHILSDFELNQNFEKLVDRHIKESLDQGLEITNLGWATTEKEICSKAFYSNNQTIGVYLTSGINEDGYYHIVEPKKQIREQL